ncbi:hypothetical protein LHK_00162 [Laribacter hongkongensis HLHK9]|uniref:Uncharacterized protein n=1 Tax=Laribacter hongkongensis (strain HLHK9) TaxID=557598 RepID=C1DA45_LARHH|nr:hypothetical protein LHK_00162 [Laribacter hongkongensis HLHK9]
MFFMRLFCFFDLMGRQGAPSVRQSPGLIKEIWNGCRKIGNMA